MVFVVVLMDYEHKYLTYVGFSKDRGVAERYLKLRKDISTRRHPKTSFRYVLREYSDEMFERSREHDPELGRCSELYCFGGNKDIPLTDDDYELIASYLDDKDTELEVALHTVIDILKLYKSKHSKECLIACKSLIRAMEGDYSGEDFYDRINWDKVIKKVIL